jgi:hypothetical protein
VVLGVDLAQGPVGLVREGRQLRVELELLDDLVELFLGEFGSLDQDLGALCLAPCDQDAFEASDDDDGKNDALVVTVQTAMVVDFAEGGGWALAGADDGSEPQSVNS